MFLPFRDSYREPELTNKAPGITDPNPALTHFIRAAGNRGRFHAVTDGKTCVSVRRFSAGLELKGKNGWGGWI